jgi:hypothetical protein
LLYALLSPALNNAIRLALPLILRLGLQPCRRHYFAAAIVSATAIIGKSSLLIATLSGWLVRRRHILPLLRPAQDASHYSVC